MSIAALLTAADAIFTIAERFGTIRDLLANNAGAAVTTQELTLMVRRETARFFNVIVSAQLDTIRREFYEVMLPTVTDRRNITPADLRQGGILSTLYTRLMEHHRTIWTRFNQIREVFFQYAGDLHVDDLVHGQFFTMRIFCLFVHIHTTYSALRRIEFSLPSMAHPDLIEDTRRILSVITSMFHTQRGICAQYNVALNARQRAVGETQYINNLWSRYWKWEDAYRWLPTTPEAHRQAVMPTSFETPEHPSIANNERSRHLQRTQALHQQTVRVPVQRFRRSMDRLRIAMQRRLALQQSGSRNPRSAPRTMAAFTANDEMVSGEEEGDTMDVIVSELKNEDNALIEAHTDTMEEAEEFSPDGQFLPDYIAFEELKSLGIEPDLESALPLEVGEDLSAGGITHENATEPENTQAPQTA